MFGGSKGDAPLRAKLTRRWGWIIVILFLGLVVPLLLATWYSLKLQRNVLNDAYQFEMDNMATILANGMRNPVWNLTPESGRAILDTLMMDPRVVSVVVTSQAQQDFLSAEREPVAGAELRTITQDINYGDMKIGEVSFVIDAHESTTGGWVAEKRVAIVEIIQLLLSLGVVLFVVSLVRRLERNIVLEQANKDLSTEIDERIRAEHALRDSEERFRSVVEHSPSILALKDTDGRFQLVNRRYENWFGVESQALIGKTPAEIFDPEITRRWSEGDQFIMTGREPFEQEIDVSFADGSIHHLRITKFPVFKANGELMGVGEFGIDLTGEHQAEEKLRQSQKLEAVGQLTGGVAHDFNNLLAVIMGNLELLRDGLSGDDQLKMIDAGISATKRGADLTQNMLAFARKARLTPEAIDLNRLVSETRNWSGRTLPASISVETSLLAGLWKIEADPSSTESALLNLILNARDAMPNGGKLTLETANVRVDQHYLDTHNEELEPGRYVMLAVSDTGDGISAETMAQIFEPFYSTKPPGAGSGLGLSMVQGFMKQSNGTVQVYSELGLGTTFKLYFKALQASVVVMPVEANRKSNPNLIGRRILVAEDEAEVLEIIVITLEKAGYEVVSANSGDRAFEIFKAHPNFDLLLTDIVMPGTLQGTTLSKEIREHVPNLRVVFMSGYASEATVHGNGLRPEDIRLMKPIMRADLLAAIEASFCE